MSRTAIALIAGLLGFFLYVAAVLALADHVTGTFHWAIEGLFFAIAGVAWVWPAKRLIQWACRPQP